MKWGKLKKEQSVVGDKGFSIDILNLKCLTASKYRHQIGSGM